MGCRRNLLVSDLKRKLMGFLCFVLFAYLSTFKVEVVSSEMFNSLVQNPGKGVNFYGKAQSNGLTSGNSYGVSDQKYSAYGDNYQDPGINCEIENPIQCDYSYPYRTYNGTCNNIYISRLGEANQCYFRFTPPYYTGHGGFRKSVKGGPLPEPRSISLKIFEDHHRPDQRVSFQYAIFGQFISADLSGAVHYEHDCCSAENANKPDCEPISLSPTDPFYSKFSKTCMDFKRTLQCSCNTTYRAQMNRVTSAIDFSHMYGNHEAAAKEIRTFDGTGKLKTNETSAGSLLLNNKDPDAHFCPKLQTENCFTSANPELNQHTFLMSLTTVFTREHNRIASRLKQLNPHWDEEKLFQEARKINTAEFQSIVFKDYLPILVSPHILEEFGMTVQMGTKGITYDPSVIIGVWNEFAVATFRLHSTVPRDVGSFGLRFKDTFSNPDPIRQGHMSELLKGSQKVPCEKFDRYIVEDLTDYLYQMPGMEYGQDLMSIDIQRGRDHGLAPYIEVVKFCSDGTIKISSFDNLVDYGIMEKENVDLLKQIYASVEDVDLWTGLQLENLFPGAVTGPTNVCINAKQFFFNQKGDRFYFDLEGPHAPFTAAQRSTLKQTSLARILCDNTDFNEITKNPFLLPGDENALVSCNEIPEVDLTQWKDTMKETS